MNRKYRKTIIAANWKMHKTATETKAFAERLKSAIPGPSGAASSCASLCGYSRRCEAAQRQPHRRGGPKPPLGCQRPLHRGDLRRYAGRFGREVRHHRPQRAPGPVWGERPDHQPKGPRRPGGRPAPHPLRGRGPAAAGLGVTLEFITYQLKAALAGVSPEDMRRVVIAYEPIWAIGTGQTATPDQAGEVCSAIRGNLRKLYGARIARSTTIQYGAL